MSKAKPSELERYKEYVRKRLAELIPILQKAATGDFRGEIKIPDKEDEFSGLVVGLSLMMDDLRELEKIREEIEETRKERLAELEKWREITTGRELKMMELKTEIKKLEEEIQSFKK